ncbi:hypothetical protein [Burkholderia reimsis]|uniref:hypothetical protein n=1 Tax=Burkholderia reimsis TaxID=2234132 RepID=UPI001058B52E|nr:hypothetical protein [Burkholderia reimsis]
MSDQHYSAGIGDLKRVAWLPTRESIEKKPRRSGSRSMARASIAAILVSAVVTWVCLDAILSDAPRPVTAHHTGK